MKTPARPALANDDALNEAIRQIGAAQRRRAGLQAEVQACREANRDRLTGAGAKSAKLAAGVVGWRTTPPKVVVRGGETVMAAIRTKRWTKRFLRVKTSVDKEALLADRERAAEIPGIKITQNEEFYIEPLGSELSDPEVPRHG